MKLSVHLITWNGAKYVPQLFESLRQQTFTDWSLLVVDNNSQDGMVEAVKKELQDFSIPNRLIENSKNLGFAGGHNMAFKQATADYVLLLNQDMYLMPDCLEKLVRFLDSHPNAAAISPRLMKWDFASSPDPSSERRGSELGFTDTIDSLGLKVFRSRRVVDWHAGKQWDGISPLLRGRAEGGAVKVFGVSGALPVFRRTHVAAVAYEDGTLFDESYNSYKEDVDLAFRLVSAGYKAYTVLDAVAYHDRSAAGPTDMSDASAAANKQKQSAWVRYHSYKNHLRTLIKNEYWQNCILDFPWILWYECKKFWYYLLFDRAVLKGLNELWQTRRETLNKRTWIISKRQLSWKAMRRYWTKVL